MEAVDSYLELVGIYEKRQIDDPPRHHWHNLLSSLINAHSQAYQTNRRMDESKAEIRRIVLRPPLQDAASVQLRRGLIRYMLTDKKKFRGEDFRDIDEICIKMADALIAEHREEVAEDFLRLGERIDRRTGRKSHPWARKVAECHETLMRRYRNTPNEVSYWQTAIHEYRRAGNLRKVRELEEGRPDVISRMPVAKICAQVDLTDSLRMCETIAHDLAQGTSEEILQFLSTDEKLLPQYDVLDAGAESQAQASPLVALMNIGIHDERSHEVQHFRTDDQKRYARILEGCELHLECFTIKLVKKVLTAAAQRGKLSAADFLQYLEKHTWLGQVMLHRVPGERTKKYRWLDLVAPAVNQCMFDLTAYFQDPLQPRYCVLAVDSLTLKLEGLVRDLCESHGITTWRTSEERTGETVSREKDLNALLHDPELAARLDKDDLLFLKFLLTEQSGYNLRNRVAHALLMSHEDYRIEYCILGLLAILRLGKYPLGDRLTPS